MYSNSGVYFTAASVSGSISLETAEGLFYRKVFSGRYGPTKYTRIRGAGASNSRASAPHYAAYVSSTFLIRLIRIIGEAFGIALPVRILTSEGWYFLDRGMFDHPHVEPRESSKQALVEIGKPAVEPLTEILRDERLQVRALATEALGEIGDRR